MSSFRRSAKHMKALLQAVQRPTQVHRLKAPVSVIESGQTSSRDARCRLLCPKNRWTTTMSSISPAVNWVPGFECQSPAAYSFSSVATPQVDGKQSGSPPLTESSTTASEDEDEPVQSTQTFEHESGERQICDEDVNKGDVVGLLAEKLALLEEKNKEVATLKEKVLSSLAEMENVRHRAKRDADSARKFAVETFAKGLLDVADNLSRATGSVPEGIAKKNVGDDLSGNLKVLQTLIQGVEMTEKQLLQVFKKHGLEKYESCGRPFDPNRHLAVFEVVDESKAPGTISLELKSGYILNDRVIRPAEVAVVKQQEKEQKAKVQKVKKVQKVQKE